MGVKIRMGKEPDILLTFLSLYPDWPRSSVE